MHRIGRSRGKQNGSRKSVFSAGKIDRYFDRYLCILERRRSPWNNAAPYESHVQVQGHIASPSQSGASRNSCFNAVACKLTAERHLADHMHESGAMKLRRQTAKQRLSTSMSDRSAMSDRTAPSSAYLRLDRERRNGRANLQYPRRAQALCMYKMHRQRGPKESVQKRRYSGIVNTYLYGTDDPWIL